MKDDLKDGEANGFIGNFCWESGQKGWNFFSTIPTVTVEDKESVLREVSQIGYASNDYVDISYDQCPLDASEGYQQTRFYNKNAKQSQNTPLGIQYESDSEGSATAQFPNCRAPQNYLRQYTLVRVL